MVLDKYNKIEYHAVKVYRPSEWSRMVHVESLQVTEGIRNLYAELLMLAKENVIVVKFWYLYIYRYNSVLVVFLIKWDSGNLAQVLSSGGSAREWFRLD